jgi:Skp family chaperone for outer membrane proteins
MNKIPWRAVAALIPVVIIAIACAVILSGCAFAKKRAVAIAAPVSAPIVAGQKSKDATILSEAAAIDQVSPEAKPHTDAQRAAVAAAPAEDVAKLVRDLESQNSALVIDNTEKDKRINALLDEALRATVSALRKCGISLVLIGVAVVFAAKLIPLGALVGSAGFVLLAAAQIWVKVSTHPWFDSIAGGIIVLGVSGGTWAVWHAWKKGDLEKKALAEATKLREAMRVIVPAFDDLKAQLGDLVKPTFTEIKGELDRDHRDIIKSIRAEVTKSS